ncbi:hypothetical protein IPM19_03130 [bacterium]|nr:MAG: hypothetical protein IPM19_03130 [bacterium]
MRRPDEIFEVTGVFAGFTNTTYNCMFVEHNFNSANSSAIQMPAVFEIIDPALIARAKELPVRSKLKLTVTRKTTATGLAAIIHNFEHITKPVS